MVRLSLIIPAYNEIERLPPYLQLIRGYLCEQFGVDYEVIVVDDGSSDGLGFELETMAKGWSQLRLIRLPTNQGKGAATRAGVLAAAGELVLFTDADGAAPIEAEADLRARLEGGYDLAVGSRVADDRKVGSRRSLLRGGLGRAFSSIRKGLFPLPVRDTQCGFKMFRREVGRQLFETCEEDGYLFDLDILAAADRRGYRLAEVPIRWDERPGSKLRLVRDSCRMLAGIYRLRRKYRALDRGSGPGAVFFADPHEAPSVGESDVGSARAIVPESSSGNIRPRGLTARPLNPISGRLLWSLLILGAILRLGQYLANRSFWLDESFLALNILERPIPQLLGPLDNNQVAPFGFLALLRLAYRLAGPSELAFRAVPLLGACLGLVLFKEVAARCLDRVAVPVAIGLFALSDQLIYYASEVKQYSTDVTVALACLLLFAQASEGAMTLRRGFALGLLGGGLLWFSHPAVFVLSGVALALAPRLVGKGSSRETRYGLAVAFACWAGGFGLFFVTCVDTAATNAFLPRYWRFAFMPMRPRTLDDLWWFVWALSDPVRDAVYPTAVPLALVALAAGGVALLSRRPTWLCALVTPVLATLLASGLGKYPFSGRLLLFLTPCILLPIAEGVGVLMDRIRFRPYQIMLLATLFVPSIQDAAHRFVNPRTRAELRPLVNYMQSRIRPGDTLCISSYAWFPFRCYASPDQQARSMIMPWYDDDRSKFLAFVRQLRGHSRVWILWGGVVDWRESDVIAEYAHERSDLRTQLDAIGRRLDNVESKGSLAMLYDCRPEIDGETVGGVDPDDADQNGPSTRGRHRIGLDTEVSITGKSIDNSGRDR